MDMNATLVGDQDKTKDNDDHKDKDKDVVMNIEVSGTDDLYRIARYTTTDTGTTKRVVYVEVCDISIIPPFQRLARESILKHLRKLEGWTDQNWHAMHVFVT